MQFFGGLQDKFVLSKDFIIGHSFREEFASKKMDPYYILRLRLEGLCEAVYMYNIV